MTKGSGYLDPYTVLQPPLPERGPVAGVPNTLPLQDLNRDAELGRVGCSSCSGQGTATSPSPRHKTNFYSMLQRSGQTNRGPYCWLSTERSSRCEESGRAARSPRRNIARLARFLIKLQ